MSRFSRQEALVPSEKHAPCVVIGVGAVGRNVALQLASIGVRDLTLIDFDTVEDHNVTTQGYPLHSIGSPKVAATAEDCLRLDNTVVITQINDRFRKHFANRMQKHCVFCAVDSMTARKTLWESFSNAPLFVDTRVLGESIRVLSSSPGCDTCYEESLYSSEEALAGSCTSKMTIYSANIAAGLAVHAYTRHLRGFLPNGDVCLSLLSSEMLLNAE